MAGGEGLRAAGRPHRTPHRTLQTIEDLLAAGDQMLPSWTLRGTHLGDWRGVPPTGRPVVVHGVTGHRLVDGRSAGRSGVVESPGALHQLGAPQVPPPGAGQ